jgi:hypothetical protein
MAEETEEVDPNMPQTDGEPMEDESEINLGKKMEEMAYRIDEMEKKMKVMEATMMPPTDSIVTEEESGTMMEAIDEDEELPKLDGAPVEDAAAIHKFNSNRKNYGQKLVDAQSTFLSKLYN